MTTLPFVQSPPSHSTRRLGTPASGILEMPVIGGLTVYESAIISEMLASERSAFVTGAAAADVIAKVEEVSLTEAFQIIEKAVMGRPLEGDADQIRIRHAERISEVARVYSKAGQANMEATVTALIRCRLKVPEWTVEDTRGLHKALFDAIWELAQEEQAAEQMPASPPTEEDLGKQPLATGNSRKPTGRKSSGS